MCSSGPRPGGKRWSKPRDDAAAYRCPERPAKMHALSRLPSGVGPKLCQVSPRSRLHAASRWIVSFQVNWCICPNGSISCISLMTSSGPKTGMLSRRPGSQTVWLRRFLNSKSGPGRGLAIFASSSWCSIIRSTKIDGMWKPLPMREFCLARR